MCAAQLLRVSVQERILAAAEDFLLQLGEGDSAAGVPVLRKLLTERLAAAAEQIVSLLEETVAEYERENRRQRLLLDAVLNPRVRLDRADVEQLQVIKEEVPPDLQDQEPPHIKEEWEEFWTSEEGAQLQGQEEADITTFPFTLVPVKSERDEEKPQFPQLLQNLTEEILKSESLSSIPIHSVKTEVVEEECGGPEPEPASKVDPDTLVQPQTDDQITRLTPPPDDTPLSVTTADVRKTFQGINPRKAAGPDNIPGRVLRDCAQQLSEVLADTSQVLSSVPTCLKTATIVPVPKRSTVTGLNVYQPIAFTPVVMKY
ncbi:uncharacterized protein ACBR49_019971 [Aulostomus maculatus]